MYVRSRSECTMMPFSAEPELLTQDFDRLKADQDFQKIVTERRNELIQDAVLKMEGYLSKDVEILQQIIEDPETSAQTRLNGIQLVFNQLGQWRLLSDMLTRLQQIEDSVGLKMTF